LGEGGIYAGKAIGTGKAVAAIEAAETGEAVEFGKAVESTASCSGSAGKGPAGKQAARLIEPAGGGAFAALILVRECTISGLAVVQLGSRFFGF
jgi:hypothetical protein